MSEDTRNKWIEAVSRMIELTQSGEMRWTAREYSPERVGQPTTPPYYAEYKGQQWRIQGEIRKDEQIVSIFPRNPNRERVDLELVDEDERSRFVVPQVPNLQTLLQTVQERSSGVDKVLEDLLG